MVNIVPEVRGFPGGSDLYPDREALRLADQFLSGAGVASHVELFPDAYQPRAVRAELVAKYNPTREGSPELLVRWFSNGDFSIRFLNEESDWRCRWEQHLNPDEQQVHFHPPPDQGDPEPIEFDAVHPIPVIETVLEALG